MQTEPCSYETQLPLQPVEDWMPVAAEPPVVVQTSAPVRSQNGSQIEWVWWLIGSAAATLLAGILAILMLIFGASIF